MPKYVDFKGEGLVEFPDAMPDDEIESLVSSREKDIQAQLIESKRQEFESETLDDPQNQPTAFERVAAGAGSLTRGAGENYARSLRGVQSLVEGAGDALPTTLREWITPATWRTSMSPKEGAEALDEALPTVDPTTQTGIQGSLVNPVMSGLGQVAGTAPLGVIPAVTLSTFSEIDDAYTREMQRQKDDGETENKAKAAGKAALYGALSGYVENKLGIGRLIRKYGKAGEEAGKKLASKTVADLASGYSEEALQKLGQDIIVDGKPDWSSINQEGIIGGLVQGIAGVPANVGNRRIGGRKPVEDTQKAHTEAPPDETIPPPSGTEPGQSGTVPPPDETNVPPGGTPPPGTRPPPTTSEANQILTILNPPEGDENAVQKPPATEGVLRKEGPEVGLPRVEPAPGTEEGETGAETEAKGLPPEVTSLKTPEELHVAVASKPEIIGELTPEQYTSWAKSVEGGQTGASNRIGLTIDSAEKLASIVDAWENVTKRMRASRESKDFDTMISLGTRPQFFSEMVQTATGIGDSANGRYAASVGKAIPLDATDPKVNALLARAKAAGLLNDLVTIPAVKSDQPSAPSTPVEPITPKVPKPPKAKKDPKAPKAPKAPKQPKAGRPRGTTRHPDVLDDVQDLLGTKGRLNREQALQIDPYFRDRPKWFKMLFRNKGTELGKMGSQIGDSGGNSQFADDHEALYWALLGVRGQRAADRAGLKREENHIKRMIRLVSGQRKPGEPKAEKHQRHPEDFAIGTTFKIAGQPVRVHARDTESGIVELRGEGDIGQTFLSETDRIYVDEGSYQDPDIQESAEDPETPFDQRPNQKRPFSRPLWEMTDDELDDIFRNPPRGRRGQDVAAKTYTFSNYDEFKQWMDERYKALDLEGMRLGYASADAAFKKRYFVENKADGHKRSWIAHVSTGYPIDQNPAPVPATERPDPPSMGTGGRGRPPSRPSEPPPPPRDPTDLAPFNLEALVQLLRTYGNYPRINTLLRKAYGQFRTKTEGVELKERLLWDPVLARRVLSHEIGHFIDLAISLPGKGKQFAERWQPLKDFKDKIAQAKDLRDAARSLSRAWRGPFVNGDSYRDSAAELFADVMSAILTKPELVNQQWPLLHDTFKGLVDGKPAFKAAYDDLTGFLKADTIGDLGTEQRREGYKASHKQVAGKEEVSRIGLWKGLRRALVSRWDHLRTILPGERSLGSRTIDQVEDNDLMSVRNGALFASRFQRTVQPEIEKIDGGGEDGRLTLAEYMEAGRVVGERTASGQWIEQNFDEALDLLNEILEAVPDLGSKYRAKLENAQTGQDLYDIAAEMFREAHDIGPSALKTIESVVNDFDDELNGAAMLQAFNVRGKLLNPSGMTVEAAQKLQAKIMARQTPAGRQAIKKAENAFFDMTSEVMTQAHDMGLIKDSTWKNLIQPNLRNYIPFSVLDYWDGKVGAGVRHQVGTAKNIADPILAMQLKMGSMFNWMQKQLTTQMLMDAYGRAGYAIPVGKRLRGPGALRAEQEKHPHDDVSRLQLWVNGQPHLIELPDDPGKSFQTATDKPSFLQDLSLWTNSYAGRLSRGALSLYTTLSPSFLFWRNTMRDFQTAANRVGYRSALKVTAKNTREAWKLSRNYARAAFGEPMLPEVERLVASGALPPPQLSRAFYHDPELLAQMIANGGLTAMQLHGARPPSDTVPAGPIRKGARAAMLFGERVASALEALPKIQTEAAARESGLTPAQATAMARRAGIPNPAIGGRWSGFIEAFMPWTRVHIQGMRSTVDMLKDPKFNKRFLGRVMAIEMAPRLARYAIASSIIASTADDDDENRGWLASLGEFFRRASPYKIAMDNLIPIGWRDNRTGEWIPLAKTFGKTAAEIPDHWEAISFRIPSSEEGKMWGSLLWGLLSGMDKDVSRAGKGVLENAGDWAINSALPGVNPTFETARQQYSLWLQGKNPLDSFRGTPAANQEMFDAGGGARAQANVGALFNQLGDAGKVAAFVATGLGMNPNATDWSHRGREKPDILTKIPVTASMFAFDNYARFRTEQNAELEEKKYGARARMLMPEDVRSLYDYYTKNVGRQKHLDDVEKQKFQVAKNWHSSIWGTRSQSTRQYSRAIAAVMPTGSKEAQATVKRDLSDISKAYVDLFDSLK